MEHEFLSPQFLEAMNDIGRYGFEKYGEQSFQERRLNGDRSRGSLNRCSTSKIGEHIREHYRLYMAQVPHDHFGTRRHQLAAVAFNAMMEFYFAGERKQPRTIGTTARVLTLKGLMKLRDDLKGEDPEVVRLVREQNKDVYSATSMARCGACFRSGVEHGH